MLKDLSMKNIAEKLSDYYNYFYNKSIVIREQQGAIYRYGELINPKLSKIDDTNPLKKILCGYLIIQTYAQGV